MATQTVLGGIFQGDIVIRTAVIRALRELREHPELIYDALASLPQDDLTADVYGEKTISACREWFLATKVAVKLGISLSHLGDAPAVIAVEMGTNTEGEATLGDVHFQPSEPDPHKPGNVRRLESVVANETYNIAIFGVGEPEYLLFLYTLVLFGLMRNKQELLADRGFDVTSFSVGVAGALDQGSPENIYIRTIQLSGKVRHSWPTTSAPKVERVEMGVTNLNRDPFLPPDWEDRDMLTGIKVR
jgi:hypothetical protein